MRAKIPARLINRAEKLIKEKKLKARPPVMLVPNIMQVDEWGDLSSQMQRILKENVRKDTAPNYGDIPKLKLVVSR